MMKKSLLSKLAAVLALSMVLTGCGESGGSRTAEKETSGTMKEEGIRKAADDSDEDADTTEEETDEQETDETADMEMDITPEQMDLIKYNYYVDLNNEIVEVFEDINNYYQVVDYTEEFALLPDSGLTYGYSIYSLDEDLIDDCVALADMDPAYEGMDELVKEMEEPLRELMTAFSDISGSYTYADNQYAEAKEYHTIIYGAAEEFAPLGYEFMDAIAAVGAERAAAEEEQMKADGELIRYNASRGISIGQQVLNEIYGQGITDENITDLDLTEIRKLYEELVQVVADYDAATADNNQLVKESLSNSSPFDGLYNALIQALEWMIKQVESGQPLDLSGSGAPLGSIGHFSETLGKCIDRYNSVFVG